MKELYTLKDFSRIRCWVLLCRMKDGSIQGYTENSFSMGWSKTHVRVFRHSYGLGKEFTLAKYREKQSNNATHYYKRSKKEERVFVARVGSKKCPIQINWWYYYHYGKRAKYEFRNLKFRMREVN